MIRLIVSVNLRGISAFMRTTAAIYRGTYCSKRPVCRSSTIALATSSGSGVLKPRACLTPE